MSSTAGAAEATSTCSVTTPTVSATLRFSVPPTLTVKSLASYWEKPCLVTVTLYPDDGTRAGAANTPASLDIMVRLMPLASFATTTVAPGPPPPEPPRRLPEPEPSPAVACAYPPATKTSAHIDRAS